MGIFDNRADMKRDIDSYAAMAEAVLDEDNLAEHDRLFPECAEAGLDTYSLYLGMYTGFALASIRLEDKADMSGPAHVISAAETFATIKAHTRKRGGTDVLGGRLAAGN